MHFRSCIYLATHNTGAASSKSYLWPITDTECQVWTQILRSTFLKLIPWRLQMSIEKTIPNTFLIMTVSTSIIIYLFSKNCWRSFIFNKNPYHFHNKTQFCIFEHITNSSFCHVFVKNTTFVTFQSLGIINNSNQNTCSSLLNITIFGEWSN